MKFYTIIQASPRRKERHWDCHSVVEDMGTETGSDLSQVTQASGAFLATLSLEEFPLYALKFFKKNIYLFLRGRV